MIKIKPNSLESIVLFAIYISVQDGKVSKEEVQELIMEAPLLKKLYFDLYGEYMDLDMIELIDQVMIYLNSQEKLANQSISKNEKLLFDNLITDPKIKDISLIVGRHVASADGLHKFESKKFNYWSKRWIA
jgi:hypothetical protein